MSARKKATRLKATEVKSGDPSKELEKLRVELEWHSPRQMQLNFCPNCGCDLTPLTSKNIGCWEVKS